MRKCVAGISVIYSLGLAYSPISPSSASITINVLKEPSCACCIKWIDVLKKAGYGVRVEDSVDMHSIKTQLNVPAALRSCHTAVAGDYVFEGHVPVDLISKVLTERPALSGLAVAGMPAGSPGMEIPGRRDPYNVMTFGPGGQSIYSKR